MSFQNETKRRMTGSEALVEALRIEGVQHITGIVGSAFMDPLDLFPAAGIRFVQVRHEQSAALMAEGYGRASGRPGVCIGQNGPGITNLVTGIASAYLNHTPVVVLTPAVLTTAIGTCAFQEIDQMRLLAPVVKWQMQVNRPDRMGEAIRGAFRAAVALRGPVQVDIPRDTYYGEWEEAELAPAQYRTDGRFGGAPSAAIAEAAALLRTARHPVILAGMGAVDADAGRDLAMLAGRLCAPAACVWLHNDAFPSPHPLALGPIGYQGSEAAMKVLSRADVVLVMGSRLNAFGTTPQYGLDFFPAGAKLIHNSIDPLELGAIRPIKVGLIGDCGEVTRQLLAALDGHEPPFSQAQRLQEVANEKAAWDAKLRAMSIVDTDPIAPRRALWEIARSVPPDTHVCADVGNISGACNSYFTEFQHARRFFGAGSLGGIGVGYPTAMGVKLAKPDAPVLALGGDGAWSMTLQEVMTSVTEKIPLVAVVFNNGVYGAERRNQYDFYGERYFYTDLDNPSFAEVAAAMGAHAVRIRKAEDIGPAIQAAFACGRAAVVEIDVDPKALNEPYRRDALKLPRSVMERYAR